MRLKTINPDADPQELISIIKTNEDCEIFKEAIENKNANDKVFLEAIKRIEQKDFITDIIVEDDIISYILKNTSNIEVLKAIASLGYGDTMMNYDEIINHPKATDEIYKILLDNHLQTKENTSKILNKINSADLIILILQKYWYWRETEIIRECINHRATNLKVFETAREIIQTHYSNSEEFDELNELIDKKEKDLKKIKIPISLTTPSNNSIFTTEEESNVTERLRMNVEDGFSTMLWGKSGIGKTARVREIDPTYTEIRLKNGMLPEEVVGGKEPNGEPGELYPPTWYVTLCEKCEREPDRMHILFIDELTNVSESIKALVMDVIEARRVNGNEKWELPENCAIVAAGNRPEESTAVIVDYNGGAMSEPLHRRFDFQIEIDFDLEEWQLWAMETNKKTGNLNIHPIVLAFCIANADKVMYTEVDNDKITKPSLDPRRWEKLSKIIYCAEKRGGKRNHPSNQRIIECIGEIAPAFIEYYQREVIDMEKVAKKEYNTDDFLTIDDKLYALSSLIQDNSLSDEVKIDFIEEYLGEEYISIYEVSKQKQEEPQENKKIR